MGHLQAFNLSSFIPAYNLRGYVETGTGEGDSLKYALTCPQFEELYSIEMDSRIYMNALNKFKDPRLTFFNGLSKDILNDLLPKLDLEKNYLFFLDAHFPEADFQNEDPGRYIKSFFKYGQDSIPLEDELALIRTKRTLNRDVILIDDLRIYEDGPFETGNWADRTKIKAGDISFIEKLLGSTHDITRNFKQQGYLILTPKNKKDL